MIITAMLITNAILLVAIFIIVLDINRVVYLHLELFKKLIEGLGKK